MLNSANELCVPPAPLTDKQLLSEFLRGDEQAFTTLVERHAELVRAVCSRVLHNASDCDDAFQATFFVLASRANKVVWQDSIAGWLHQVARRVSLKLRANTARRRCAEAQTPAKQVEASDDPIERVGIRELGAILDTELAKLPDHLRDAILITQFEGLSRAEAASRLGTSVAVVKDRLERGREYLRRRLLKRGVTLSSATLAAWFASGSAQAAEVQNLVVRTGPLAIAFAAGKSVSAQLSASAALAETVLKFTGMQKVVATIALLLSLATGGSLAFGFLQDNPRRFHSGLRGRVVNIDQDDKPSLTIQLDEFDTLLNLDISSQPKVWIAFKEAQLDKLKVGQLVALQLDSDNRTIKEIHAQGPVREVTVKAIGSDDKLVVEADDDDANQAPLTLQLSRDAIIRLGDMAATRDDLLPGMSVPLEFDSSAKVIHAIEADVDPNLVVEGQLIRIDLASKTLLLLAEDESDQLHQRTFSISESALFTRDGKSIQVQDLEIGSAIKVRLAANDDVVRSVMVVSPPERN